MGQVASSGPGSVTYISYPMFIEHTITRILSGFSGYIWLDTKIVLLKYSFFNHFSFPFNLLACLFWCNWSEELIISKSGIWLAAWNKIQCIISWNIFVLSVDLHEQRIDGAEWKKNSVHHFMKYLCFVSQSPWTANWRSWSSTEKQKRASRSWSTESDTPTRGQNFRSSRPSWRSKLKSCTENKLN